ERFPSVRILRLGRNRGPGPARNAGAREAGNDRILFIDNDVVLLPGCAELLCEALDLRQEATFAMPAVLYARRAGTVQYDGAGAHFVGLMIIENADLPVQRLSTELREIDSLITACFLTDRRRWGEDPLFDEAFFFYFEDHELGLRARLGGHAILSVPAARCLHGEGSIGVSLRQTGAYTGVRIRNTMLNRWRILLKLYEVRTLLLLSPALVSFEVFQFTGALAKGWVRHWLWAAMELGRGLSTIGAGRRAFQRHRCLGDGDVLTGGPLPFNPALSTGRTGRLARGLLQRVAQLNWKIAHRFLRRSIGEHPRVSRSPA
ncbi:MAG TPA: glycosyltransferase, partial [Gemmatimonadota bacterium]|nr:glycosyltransferase [Gemmatimonadota bacterium]